MSNTTPLGDMKISDIPGLEQVGLLALSALGRGEYVLTPVISKTHSLPPHHPIALSQSGHSHKDMIKRIDLRFSLSSWAIDYLRRDIYPPVSREDVLVHVIRIEHLGGSTCSLLGLIARAKEMGYTLLDTELLCELRLALTEEVFVEERVPMLIIPVQPHDEQLLAPFFVIQKNADIRNFSASYLDIEEYDRKDCALAFLAPR
jgi:hypothetical protein